VIHHVKGRTERDHRVGERKGHPDNPVLTRQRRVVDAIPADESYDVVLVRLNAFQLERALTELVPETGDATRLIMSANWEGTGAIDRLVPRSRYVLGYPDGGGTLRDDQYWVNIGPEMHVGLLDGQDETALERIRAVFARADLALDIPPDILHWLWIHNASAVGFAGGYAKHLDVRSFLADKVTLRACFAATHELLTVCERRGVPVKKYPDVAMLRWPTWLTVPLMRYQWTHNASMQRYTAHAASPGALRELADSQSAMVATADDLGLPAPVLRQLGAHLERRVAEAA
jgi:2-dehydropantoate 2-reductase